MRERKEDTLIIIPLYADVAFSFFFFIFYDYLITYKLEFFWKKKI
jgi:hypothetical protein